MPDRMPLYRPPGWRSEAQRRTAYDRDRMRNGGDVYNNTRWRKLRAAYLATHPICECGCGWPATVVDHRKAHHGDDALMWSWDNLQAMTKACHDRKTATHDGGFGNRMVRPPATSDRATATAGCIEGPIRCPEPEVKSILNRAPALFLRLGYGRN